MSETKTNEVADSITFLAEQLKVSEDMFDYNIANVFDNIVKSFYNDSNATMVDGLYAISESIDKLARAINKK